MNWMMKMILANMKKRKLRTGLTMLGIVIGVLSIMLMTSVGIGMKTELLKDIEAMGSINEITIYGSSSPKKSMQLNQRNMDKLMEDTKNIEAIYPCFQVSTEYEFEKYYSYMDVVGVPSEYLENMNYKYGEVDNNKRLKPALYVGGAAMRTFYSDKSYTDYYEDNKMDDNDIDFTGRKFRTVFYAENQKYEDALTVQGVMDNQDYRIYCDIDELIRYMKMLPDYTFTEGLDNRRDMIYSSVIVRVDGPEHVDEVFEKIQEKGYMADCNKVYADQAMKEMKTVQAMLGLIGGIAFIVAIIGIINTMTTSVYDRMKEIGVLKVLGCDPEELQMMFLAEAGIMGLIGGLVGVAVSYLLSYTVINKLGKYLFEMETSGALSVIPWWLTIAAIVVSTTVGMAAGYFPSRYVRKLTPINSMKHE